MQPKTAFVLVHGASLGGWCWARVRQHMEKADVLVFTPTLSGMGERAHLTTPVPSLDTHIEDIVRVIETEELEDVVLVGHSYAGMVITAVADRIKSRIAHLVYLDAAVPNDSNDFASHVPGTTANDAERRRTIFRSMSKDSVWIDPLPAEKAGISNPADIEWVNRRTTPHPLRTWLDPVKFQNTGHQGIPKTYILATRPMTTIMGYPSHGEVAKKGGEWTYREIACGHVTMVVEPELTAELLLEAGAHHTAQQLGDHHLEDDPRFLKRVGQARTSLRAGHGVAIEDIPDE